jgi:hypothetical protein
MKKLIVLLMILFVSNICFATDNSAGCEDVGQFARQSATLMEKGALKSDQYEIVNLAQPDNPEARRILKKVIDGVYDNDYSPKEAYETYTTVCIIANARAKGNKNDN